MTEFEVRWVIEVEGESPQDAADYVNDTYIQPCESGDWVYEVENRETGETTMVQVLRS